MNTWTTEVTMQISNELKYHDVKSSPLVLNSAVKFLNEALVGINDVLCSDPAGFSAAEMMNRAGKIANANAMSAIR